MRKNSIIFILAFSLIFISIPIYADGLPNGYLKYGSRGSRVVEVQKALNKIGYDIYADGIYGKNTKASILNLQRKYKELANDGIYGSNTRKVMEKLLSGDALSSKDKDDDTAKGKKIAYLTFDDGPSTTVTPKILDILSEHDIKATFFILGSMAEKSPDILKRIQNEGHSIGNHSYSHKYHVIYKNMDNFLNEINSTNKIMKNILGEDFNTSLLRFPGGSFEDYKQKYRKAANDRGYRVYNWNALNGDAEGKQVSVGKLISRLKETTKGQQQLVVLMHDTYGKETTAKALPSIIKYLSDSGYSFEKIQQ